MRDGSKTWTEAQKEAKKLLDSDPIRRTAVKAKREQRKLFKRQKALLGEERVIPNTKGIEVLTPTGFQPFSALVVKPDQYVCTYSLEDGSSLDCTMDHKIYQTSNSAKEARHLVGRNLIDSDGNRQKIVSEKFGMIQPVYDLLDVAGGNRFNVGKFIVSNCRFTGESATLIEPIKLLQLNATTRKPRLIDRHGCVWYSKIRPNTIHVIAMDPSEGTGGDRSVIQVWSIPDMVQVAEWASNSANQIEQTRMLVRIMRRIWNTQQENSEHDGESEIYYSVECNGMGMGIINAIILEGEEKFPGQLIDSEGNKTRGLRTTPRSKHEYCLQLKKLIERGLFVPASKPLVSELKDFVRRGKSYEAKLGSKDDRVMSCVLMLHMMDELKYMVEGIEEATHVAIADLDPDEADSDAVPLPPMVF